MAAVPTSKINRTTNKKNYWPIIAGIMLYSDYMIIKK